MDKALRLDSQIMLVDDPVKRVDTMTMAHSLEARVPFLDHQLVEFAARIPLAGSAYTYAYFSFGEFPAFLIGWDLTLEYMIGSATVN